MKWMRMFSPVKWYAVEPQENNFFWPFDKLIDQVKGGYQMEVMPILGYDVVTSPSVSSVPVYPEWASSGVRSQGGWGGGILARVDTWSDYVYSAVDHYKDKITYWEVLNEPNGTMQAEDYLPYLEAAYRAAKRADPHSKTVCPATGFDFLEDLLELGGGEYCDVISVHLYKPGMYASFPPESPYPLSLEEAVKKIKELIETYAPGKKLWNSETGLSTPSAYRKIFANHAELDDSLFHGRVRDSKLQADYMVRAYLIELATGVDKFFYFLLDPPGINIGSDYSLLNYDMSPQPALLAYDAMTSLLEGAKFEQEITLGEKIYAYLFEKERKPIVTLWTWGFDKTVTVPLPLSKVQVLDIMGNPMSVETRGSSFTLTISGSPIYVEGIGLTAEEMAAAFEQPRVSEVP